MRLAFVLTVLWTAVAPGVARQSQFEQRVDVARVLVDARVVDRRGQPLGGLSSADFEVRIDGRAARIDTTEWHGPEWGDTGAAFGAPGRREAGMGRLIVFFVQKDLQSSRVEGYLRMLRESARFVDRLGPDDRGAVVLYDSRLRLWQDFTSNRARLRHVLAHGLLSDKPSTDPADGPSIRAHMDGVRAAGAHSIELGLQVLGDALRSIPGAKTLVLLGYGFGRFEAPFARQLALSRAVLDQHYEHARESLIAARVTVFALDITKADHHTLEQGLMTVAEDTGGFYARTHLFAASGTMDRLAGALRGFYVLSVERPPDSPERPWRRGRHEIDVRVRAGGATVLARRFYVD